MTIKILTYQSTTAAGLNIDALRQSIDCLQTGLRKNDLAGSTINTWIGKVDGVDGIDLGSWQSRNNALAELGYQQGDIALITETLIDRYGAHRLGIVIGSSTSSIDRTEQAYHSLENQQLSREFAQPLVHNPGAPSLYLAHRTGISGPAITINTACSSSAKAFATAARWLRAELVDAVLVGGVDTLCLSVLHGFHALQLVSENQCKPLDQHRDGINLGEAAGFAWLVRGDDIKGNTSDDALESTGIALLGYGESSDAYHMSHPHPEGAGARAAMTAALNMAGLEPGTIDYINLHGTSSRANDRIEGALIGELFPASTWVSSTKAWTGHTLGAAGITEALIAVDALKRNIIPATLNLEELDHELDISANTANIETPVNRVMSNSFGFGGNNCSLVFGRVE